MVRNYNKIGKEIAETGFFSEYLPPCFKLNKKVFNRIPVVNCDLIQPYSFTMSRYNGNDARRSIFIPEIGAYVVANNFIKENNIIRQLVEFTESNEASFSPILGENDSIVRHEETYNGFTEELEGTSSQYIDNIAKKIINSAGSKKILKLDISNCFSSVYMHIIPAILLGYEEAEENYNKFLKDSNDPIISQTYIIYRKLDEVIRRQNMNRTNGLLPGPLTSKIIAEAIFTRIDSELKSEGLKFARYVDDYEVYIYDNEIKLVISTFTKILKRYGFSLNNEKTEEVEFPYYVAENLEKIFKKHIKDDLENSELMELFNSYFTLEKSGTKGAVRYLLKTLEKNPISPANTSLYKAYLITIIENNERSLTKACSLFINNKDYLILEERDILLIKEMLSKHISLGHDLEVLWLLYLLIETSNIEKEEQAIQDILDSKNELAHIILLRKNLLTVENLERLIHESKSWILLYELYVSNYINEETFISKLNVNKNLDMYRYLKQNNVHFCE